MFIDIGAEKFYCEWELDVKIVFNLIFKNKLILWDFLKVLKIWISFQIDDQLQSPK